MVNRAKHIFLIEDDESMRTTLKGLLEFAGYQVHDYSSPLEFLNVAMLVAPAVIITDMSMPGMSGVDLQIELAKRDRKIPVIFISGESTVQQSIDAMKQGAIDFLVKPFDRHQLMEAVAKGLSQDAQYMRQYIDRAQLEESLKSLAPREREVFDLLALGFNNSQIMENLSISLPTAKQYKAEVMRKLNLRSLSQLIELKKLIVA